MTRTREACPRHVSLQSALQEGSDMTSRTRISMASAACLAILGAAASSVSGQATPHLMQAVKDVQWGAAPPILPPGAQIAVLAGDPGKAAPFTVRLKFPANYTIPAHSHPGDEHVVVVSGSLTFGM